MTTAAVLQALTDEQIVERTRAGESALFEVLMRRHNQRVYRAARAILNDEAEVEDVMQQAYINAFTHLHQFESRAQFSTWLTRITVYEALSRRRRMRPFEPVAMTDAEESRETMHTFMSPQPDTAGVFRRASAADRDRGRCPARCISVRVHAAGHRRAQYQRDRGRPWPR
jgi:RNA polymerase sigma factor (sigma-70 family)